MDIVITLGKGSRWQDNELRYSLRSLEKFGRNVGRVFIIGELPDFINDNPTHIHAKDQYGHERNIMEKLMIACNNEMVSENFIAWQDDYFLTDFIDCDNYPFYYCGGLENRIGERITGDGYRISMNNTFHALSKNGRPTNFYDIHFPITYNKSVFKSTMQAEDWNVRAGYVIKSLYANTLQPTSHQMPDVKFNNIMSSDEIKSKLEGRHIFSVGDLGLHRNMKEFLAESYPEKSKYEK